MKFMFTRSTKIGSKLIQWALNEKVSHFAIGFDCTEDGYGIVLHSHMGGVGIEWYNDFLKRNEVVYELVPTAFVTPLHEQEKIYQAIVQHAYGKPYDRLAFAYFAVRALAKKMFGWPLPERNPWQMSNQFLCTELYEQLRKADPFMFPPLEKDAAIATPMDVFEAMSESKLLTPPAGS